MLTSRPRTQLEYSQTQMRWTVCINVSADLRLSQLASRELTFARLVVPSGSLHMHVPYLTALRGVRPG